MTGVKKKREHYSYFSEKKKKNNLHVPTSYQAVAVRSSVSQRRKTKWTTTFQVTTLLTNGWSSLRPTRVVVVVVALAVVFLRRLQWYRAFGGRGKWHKTQEQQNICDLNGRTPGETDKITRARNTAAHDRERERRRRKMKKNKRTRNDMLVSSALLQQVCLEQLLFAPTSSIGCAEQDRQVATCGTLHKWIRLHYRRPVLKNNAVEKDILRWRY